MSDISKLTIEGIEYNIKDETARADIENIREELMGTSAMANEILDVLDGISSEDKIEVIIDASGVLDSTEGSVEEKVGQLVDYSYLLKNQYGIRVYGNDSLEYINFYIDWANSVEIQYARNLKVVIGVNTTKTDTCRSMFLGCAKLVSIQIPFDVSKHSAYNMNNMFAGCTSLVDVRFVAETIKGSITFASSSLLSAESIQSIIDGLATVETAQTLTLHADVKILQSQVDSANAKGWTVAGGTVVSEEEYYG